jgi:hypothetical protein
MEQGPITKTKPIVVIINPKNYVNGNLFMYYHLISIDKICCKVCNVSKNASMFKMTILRL